MAQIAPGRRETLDYTALNGPALLNEGSPTNGGFARDGSRNDITVRKEISEKLLSAIAKWDKKETTPDQGAQPTLSASAENNAGTVANFRSVAAENMGGVDVEDNTDIAADQGDEVAKDDDAGEKATNGANTATGSKNAANTATEAGNVANKKEGNTEKLVKETSNIANNNEELNAANGSNKNVTNAKNENGANKGGGETPEPTKGRDLKDYVDAKKGEVVLKPENGPATRVWGDPHVDFNNDGSNEFDFYENTKFVLGDGTEIISVTVNGDGTPTTADHESGATFTGKVLLTRDGQYLSYSNIHDGGDIQTSEDEWEEPYISNILYESEEGWRMGAPDGELATTELIRKNEGKK